MTTVKKITAVLLVLSFVFAFCACKDPEYYSTDATIGAEHENDMEAIISGTYYFDAVMSSYGETGKIVFAVDGENIFMQMEMNDESTGNVEMGIISLGEVIYMLYENSYAELDDSVLKMMDVDTEGDVLKQLGFDKEELLSMFTELDEGTDEQIVLDGADVTKTTYLRTDGGTTIAYLDKNGDLLRTESLDRIGNLVEVLEFTDVSGVVPTELFILDNYEKTNILKLMFEMSKVMMTTEVSE